MSDRVGRVYNQLNVFELNGLRTGITILFIRRTLDTVICLFFERNLTIQIKCRNSTQLTP